MNMNDMTKLLLWAAVAAFIIGGIMLAKSDKQRTETGEWSNALQWGYLLMMVGVFGMLASSMSFTAVLLIFVAFTGIVWLVHKSRLKKDPSHRDTGHFTDYMSGFFPIIFIVFVLRTFIVEPYQIPSSSMRPGLVVGDFILVNKFSYGIRTPIINNVLIDTGKVQRGDVAVFNYPEDPNLNYIKRIVGIPGDTVEYRDKILKVNGETAQEQYLGVYSFPRDDDRSQPVAVDRYQTTLSGRSFGILKSPQAPSFDPNTLLGYQNRLNQKGIQSGLAEFCQFAEDGSGFTCKVPEGRYFALGDNRDHSADSRYWGFVDDKLIVGKAFFVWMNFSDFGRIGTGIN